MTAEEFQLLQERVDGLNARIYALETKEGKEAPKVTIETELLRSALLKIAAYCQESKKTNELDHVCWVAKEALQSAAILKSPMTVTGVDPAVPGSETSNFIGYCDALCCQRYTVFQRLEKRWRCSQCLTDVHTPLDRFEATPEQIRKMDGTVQDRKLTVTEERKWTGPPADMQSFYETLEKVTKKSTRKLTGI